MLVDVVGIGMMPTRQGSIRLFRFAGIEVFLHWSWFVVALYEIEARKGAYSSTLWNVLEYLALFAIVLMHEFGHSLACRQVGGRADQIVLWPLGGVAYVNPPPRPGATLWSIAAGPLVNVALVPILLGIGVLARSAGLHHTAVDAYQFLQTLLSLNIVLLVFNLMPVYPLDGGQILRSLLWFAMGRAASLGVASAIGFLGVAGLAVLAWFAHNVWFGVMCVFIGLNCINGLVQARTLARAAKAPRHIGFRCPGCGISPVAGAWWICGRCRKAFDTFNSLAVCPNCGAEYPKTTCMECGNAYPINDWLVGPPPPPGGAV